MKVTEIHEIGNESADEYNGKGSLEILVQDDNGLSLGSLNVTAGEPEDAVFFRDLSGAYSIEKLMRLAYEAGKNGEDYLYEFINYSEGEDE